jgi:RNA polymerase sigma-70 factor (sigma-E family)
VAAPDLLEPTWHDVRPLTDVHDFVAFYRTRWDGAVRVARLLVGDHAAAEEVAQEVFLAMRGRWGSIDTPDAYLRRSLVNRSNNHHRRASRETTTDRPWPAGGAVHQPEVDDELWQAVLRLPHRARAALVLRFYEDRSEAEIADALGCRPGTVKSLIHRGLAKLKEDLG